MIVIVAHQVASLSLTESFSLTADSETERDNERKERERKEQKETDGFLREGRMPLPLPTAISASSLLMVAGGSSRSFTPSTDRTSMRKGRGICVGEKRGVRRTTHQF